MIELTREQEEEIKTKISSLYYKTINSSYYQNKLKLWKECHELCLTKDTPTSFPWPDASNVDLGIIEMTVDNMKARFKLSTIGAKPMFNVIPTTPKGEAYKDKVQDFMNYVLDNEVDIDRIMDDICQKTVEYGTCITKTYWTKEIEEVMRLELIEGAFVPTKVERINQRVKVEVLALEDVIVPEGLYKEVDELPWIMHRIWLTVSDLKKKAQLGFYPQDRVDDIISFVQIQKDQQAKTAEEKIENIKQLPEEKIEILEVYMRHDIDDDMIDEECIFWYCPKANVLLKAHLLIEIFYNNKRPFHVYRYKDTGTFYGRGIPEILKPYRKAINDVFNYGVNCAMLQILPFGFYRLGSSFRPEEVKLAPGVMIPVDDPNDVRITQFPPSAALSADIVMLLMSFIERQSGISAPHMGKEFPTRKTATEIRTIITEGSLKHEDRIASFQEVFSKHLKFIFQLYKDNPISGRTLRIVEGETVRFEEALTPLEMQQLDDFDFVVLGSLTTGNKALEREDTLALYALVSKHPILQEYYSGQLELLKEVFNAFGKRNIKRFLPPEEYVGLLTEANMRKLMALMLGGEERLEKRGPATPREALRRPPQTGLPPEVEMRGAKEEL